MPVIYKNIDPASVPTPDTGKTTFSTNLSSIPFIKDDAGTVTYLGGTGTVTSVATGTGLTGGPITTTGTISLANTAVTPASYTNANITVDAQGRITAAANGTPGGVTSVGASAPIASSGGATPTISISQATTSTDGYLSSTDWNIFNNKGSGTVTSVGVSSTDLTVSGSPVTTSGSITLDLATTAVTPASYTYASITVDSKGRITAASNGTAPSTTINNITSGTTTYYPTFVDVNTGTVTTLDVASSYLSFTPRTAGTTSRLSIGGQVGGFSWPGQIVTPDETGANGANLQLLAGATSNTGSAGGSIDIVAGSATTGAAGSVSISDGAAGGSYGGVSVNGKGGIIFVTGSSLNHGLLISSNGSWGIGSSYSTGTSGQVLTSSGASGDPTWTTPTIIAPKYEEYVATASQTVFNTTMTTTAKASGKAYLQVYVNGVLQMEGATKKFTVTGATQITFGTGLALNDDVAIFGYA